MSNLFNINEYCEQGRNAAESQNAKSNQTKNILKDTTAIAIPTEKPLEVSAVDKLTEKSCEIAESQEGSLICTENKAGIATTAIDSSSLTRQQGASDVSKRSLLNINEYCERGRNAAESQNAKSNQTKAILKDTTAIAIPTEKPLEVSAVDKLTEKSCEIAESQEGSLICTENKAGIATTAIDSSSLTCQQGASDVSKRSLLNINEYCEQGRNAAESQNAKSNQTKAILKDTTAIAIPTEKPLEVSAVDKLTEKSCEIAKSQEGSLICTENKAGIATTAIDSSSLTCQQGASDVSKRSLLNINEYCEQGRNAAESQNAKSNQTKNILKDTTAIAIPTEKPLEVSAVDKLTEKSCEIAESQEGSLICTENKAGIATTAIDSSSLTCQQGASDVSKRSLFNINEYCEQGRNAAESQNAKSILRVFQITDPHLLHNPNETFLGINPYNHLAKIVDDVILSKDPTVTELLLLTGDISQDFSPKSYQNALGLIDKIKLPTTTIPGNHDEPNILKQTMVSDQANVYCSIAYDNWHIILLNSQWHNHVAGQLDQENLLFLQRELNNNHDKDTIIFVHHHILPVGTPWVDSSILTNAAQFLAIISQHQNIKAVFSGHVHQESATKHQHVNFYTAPAVSWQFTPQIQTFKLDVRMPGYRIIDLYKGGKYSTNVIRLPYNELFIPDLNSKGY